MEIRLISENEILKAKSLWKTAFGDSGCFIDTYFKNRVYPGNSPAIFDDGKLICILHFIPYKIDIRGKAFDTAFIVGAATHPDYRKKGLMAVLLKESLKILKQREICVTHLYPFLHAFYEHFGWATVTNMAHCKVKAEKIPGYTFSHSADYSDMAGLYQKAMRNYTGFLIRSAKQFIQRMEEASCDGGKTAFAFLNGGLKAYAMYEVQDSTVQVFEPVFESKEALHALLAEISREEGDKEITLSYPPHITMKNSTMHEVKPYGMARITDIELLLKLLPIGDTSFILEVKDEFARWNEGVFEVSYDNGAAIVKRTDKKAQIAMDIQAFTQLMHGYAGIDVLEQTGKVIIPDKGVKNIFNEIFPQRRTFLFEAY